MNQNLTINSTVDSSSSTIDCRYSIVTRHSSTLRLMQAFFPITVQLVRIILPTWVALGVPGSLLSLAVWSSRRLRTASSIYLSALALLDAAFLLLQQLPWHLHAYYDLSVVDNLFMCSAFPVFSLWLQYLAPLLILAFTVERYIAIFHPFVSRRFCTPQRSMVVSGILATICLPLALVQLCFFRYDRLRRQCLDDERVFEPGTPRHQLYHIWSKTTEVLFFAVTPLTILLFNSLVLTRARRSSSDSSRRRTTTATLLCVSFYQLGVMLPVSVLLFLGFHAAGLDLHSATCNLTDSQVTAEMAVGRLPEVAGFFQHAVASSLVSVLAVSHSAVKLFIYLATGAAFRRQLMRMMRLNGRNRSSWTASGLASAAPAQPPLLLLPVRRTAQQRRRLRRSVDDWQRRCEPATVRQLISRESGD